MERVAFFRVEALHVDTSSTVDSGEPVRPTQKETAGELSEIFTPGMKAPYAADMNWFTM